MTTSIVAEGYDEVRQRKDKENARWERMDAALLEMIASTTKVMVEIVASNGELRKDVHHLTGELQRFVTLMSTGADYRRRSGDTKTM